MKNVTALVEDPEKLIGQTQAGSKIYPKEVARLVNELFDEFRIRCRNWEKTIPHSTAAAEQKKDYVKRLVESGITEWSVVLAAKEHVCSELRWFQKADDFVEICRCIAAERLGLPSEAVSYQQATGHQTKKHPAVIATLRGMDTQERYRFRQILKEDAAEKFWKTRWRRTVRDALKGKSFPAEEPQVEMQSRIASKEKNLAETAKLKSLFK